MATLRQIIEAKNRRLNEVPDEFLTKVEKAQKAIFTDLLELAGQLEVKDGNLVANSSNLNKIGGIVEDLRNALGSGSYPKAVKKFISEFGVQKVINDQYFEKAFGQSSTKFANALLKKSQADARDALLGTPIDKEFLIPVESLLTDAVGTQGTWKETVQNIRAFAEGSDEKDGKLLRYSKQIAHDRFAISDRSYTNAVADEVDNEWYLYSGSTIETSRCFCVERHQKYFHWKEIRDWGAGKNLGDCEYKGLWQGAFSNTTAENIFIYAGGANCRHSIMPVSVFDVPADVISRNLANGNYNPSSVEAKELNLEGDFSQTENIQDVVRSAKEASIELKDITERIASDNGANITPINLKSEESILRKARTDYNGNVSLVWDTVRTTIVSENEKLPDVLEAIKAEFSDAIVKFKQQTPDLYDGYSGYLFNVRLSNGTIGEVQVNTPKMIFAKESPANAKRIIGEELWNSIKKETGLDGGLGHKYYEESRLATTSEARKEELRKLSREYYNHFREEPIAKEAAVDMSAIKGKGVWSDIVEEFNQKLDEFNKVYPNLSIEEKQAIFGYTRTDTPMFRLINDFLRTGFDESLPQNYTKQHFEEYIKLMNNALKKINETHTGDVWRGITVYGEEKVASALKPYIEAFKSGSIITEKTFVSTSASSSYKFRGNIYFKIKSKFGKSIKKLSDVASEEEVLFKPGSKFKVIDMKEDSLLKYDGSREKIFYFTLEEVE